ncbi:MAG: FTR1 family protein [Gammaproteobacteria bacterium]|nr:FTR1 family protein [Gammaproteobacteria bacterium]
MFATTLIVFREMLEAALIIGIVMAATRGARHRIAWVSAGIGAGLLGAGLVAGFADAIASAIEGMGQELFNATVLFLAVAMLGWHTIWMKQHGRELAANMKAVGREVASGERPLYLLAIVIGIAVLREGSEVVLFLYGIAASAEGGTGAMLSGGLLGLAGGAAVGLAMYFGLLRIPTRHLFSVTTGLILLLAAGMAAQGAGYLVQAGILPALGTSIWDTSNILSEHSAVGQLLHILIGYIARPDGIQVAFYFSTLLLIGGSMKFFTRQSQPMTVTRATAGLAIAAVASVLLTVSPRSEATQKVYSPHVEKGELELEARSHIDNDDDNALDGARKDKYEVGYGFTDWWFSSVFAEYEREAHTGEGLHHEATSWENIFQLTEPGQYWLDAGLYLEYEDTADDQHPNKLETKLLLEKAVGRYVHTANIVMAREVGGGAANDVELEYAWRTKYKLMPELEPGIELYGTAGTLDDAEINDSQEAQLGPVASGKFRVGGKSAIGYELGYLVGLNDATADGSIKWLVEYEYVF